MTESLYGINLIGNISANSGLGVYARHLADFLIAKGHEIRVFDADFGRGLAGHDCRFDHLVVSDAGDLPYKVNLFALDPPSIFHFLAANYQFCFEAGRLNAAFAFWELPSIPDDWVQGFRATDVLLAASDFVRGTFERHLSETFVVPASCALSLPGEIGANREAFELPANGTLFFTGFDPGSDPERKNPFGAVRAFWRAFGGSRDAYLVVKVNNAVRNGVRHPVADQLKALCRGHGNILVIDRVMSYADALSLLASCDVYVSLHRAEGLGLGLMEAMCLGKPVIATAWSGNMSFMDHANSCLVGYRLIPVNSTLPAYRQFNGKTQWAEPSEERAAAWMRELARDPELRIRIGLNAKRSVSAYDAAARAGHFLDELEAIALHAAFLPRRVLPPPADLWRAARGPVKGVFAGVRGEVTRQWRRHIGWRLQ